MKPLLAALVITLAPLAAHAFSSVPGHADISVKPKHQTVNGVKCVVGCTVKFKVRRVGSAYTGATSTRPSVLLPDVARRLANSSDESRHAVYEPSQSQALKLFPDIAIGASNQVYDGEISFTYEELGGAAAGVQSGAKLTLVTAWKYQQGTAPHVYGTVTSYDEANEFTLP